MRALSEYSNDELVALSDRQTSLLITSEKRRGRLPKVPNLPAPPHLQRL